MSINLLHRKGYLILIGIMIVFGLLFTVTEKASAQADYPSVPVLSLTGALQGWDAQVYPDGRIWLPPSKNGYREFLLPVYINNRWATNPSKPWLKAEPIYSFRFTLLYDETAVRAIDVQKYGVEGDLDYDPLAKDFDISFDDKKDYSHVYNCPSNPSKIGTRTSYYGIYIDSCISFDQTERGRAITIVGVSNKPLPNTDLTSYEFKVLLYVRFRVLPQDGTPIGQAGITPIMIDDRDIRYNDINIRKVNPFKDLAKLGYDVSDYEPVDNTLIGGGITGLGGINNKTNTGTGWKTNDYTKPGMIYLCITDRLPKFDLRLNRGGFSEVQLDPVVPDKVWSMVDPLTVDSARNHGFQYGSRRIQIMNSTDRNKTRLLDVQLESNEPWLEFRSVDKNGNALTPWTTNSQTWPKSRRFRWIDNNILGSEVNPNGEMTTDDEDRFIEVRANPAKLTEGQEKTGEYYGYITIKSHTAEFNSVQLRVTFIHFKNPIEAGGRGIRVKIKNARGTIPPIIDSVMLVFGTGFRASDRVDSLYGEYHYTFPMQNVNNFTARWFPPDSLLRVTQYPNGFGDFLPNDENPYSVSRDIRDIHDTLESLIYYCKFANRSPLDVVIEWDTRDFPDGSQLFLRDTVNGTGINLNMREGTIVYPNGTVRSYTSKDPNFNRFVIEYTVPRVVKYINEKGESIVKKGWNLLSLPVRPTDNYWRTIYPNALNIPYFFNSAGYQFSEELKVGVGYFVKFSDLVDNQFAGTYIKLISVGTGDPVLLLPGEVAGEGGWNTIGCLTEPVNINDIKFDRYTATSPLPDLDYSKKYGIWGYQTNRGYSEVSELLPGMGYWIKVNRHGYLRLVGKPRKVGASDEPINNKHIFYNLSTKLVLRDNAQNEAVLYYTNNREVNSKDFEMPPLPPAEMFDVRYLDNKNLANEDETYINLQGVSYPVSISINNADADYTFSDPVTGLVYGIITKGNTGNVIVEKSVSNIVKVNRINNDTELFVESYPNPVENYSTIRFSVPENNNVTIKLYDIMGKEIGTIADGYFTRGEYTRTLDATGLTAGTYLLKMVIGDNNIVKQLNVVR